MLFKAPRWVLVTEAVVVVCAAALVAYKAAMWVRPLGRVEQAQFLKKVDPKLKIREYYVEYPASYIRIAGESWQYSGTTRIARHRFTLTNQATVGYADIRIELTYQSGSGKTVHAYTITLPATLAAISSMEITGLEVKHVPPESERALIRVVAARVIDN